MKKSAVAHGVQGYMNQLSVDTSEDDKFLNSLPETWDDLNEMKNDTAHAVLEFVMQVEGIGQQQIVIQNLGQHTAEYQKLLTVFYTDIDSFTKSVETLRLQHEGRTGRILSMDDLNLYNQLGMEYAVLNQKLMTLIGPTITSLILIVNEVTEALMPKQPVQTQEGIQHE